MEKNNLAKAYEQSDVYFLSLDSEGNLKLKKYNRNSQINKSNKKKNGKTRT